MAKDSDEGGSGRQPKDYAVGYRRPPVEHRFRKGDPSPNPFGKRGRPKPSPDEESFLDQKIWINENGKKRRITRDEYVNRKLFGLVNEGDVQASKRLDERVEMRKRQDAERRHTDAMEEAARTQNETSDSIIISRAVKRAGRGK